ncbi:T9SS type A sorting domain-containing protein, partial [Mesonia mobilis]
PLYRSILPLDSPQRYLPNLQDVLDGDLTPTWEVTPSVSREMNFSFIVRDNGSGFSDGIGQTDSDLMTVTVNDQAGPFTVTSQNESNVTWYEGENQIVTWDVANTNTAPINATNVDIYLSTNAGQTFETTLASNVPNNGSATITVPLGTSTNNARLMVKASENIFYAVNQEEFNIETSSFFFTVDNLTNDVCAPNTAEYSFTYNTNNSFSGSTDFSAENLPAGLTATFNPSSASSNDTDVTLTITGTENVDFGTYEFDLTGNSGTESFSTSLSLGIFGSSLETPDLLTPSNEQTGVNQNPVLTWEELPNANTYQLQIASDEQFIAIIVDTETENNTYAFTESQLNTNYFWRVKAFNPCSETEYSNFFEFQISDCSVCPSEGNLDYDTATTLVNFNTINNPTPSNKENAYNDFTDISTQVVIGETYDMTININTGGNYICGTLVWIDWNQNCSFDDPGEEYDLGAALNVADGITNNSPLGITAPDDAALGETIMRVSTRYEVYPEACGIGFDGEVEDYTVIVTDELSTSSNELADSFAIYPNPNQGEFTVSLRSENPSPIDINVFDITGRRIFTQSYEYQHDFSQNLRLNQAQAGVYFVKVSNGNNNVTKKVIVE